MAILDGLKGAWLSDEAQASPYDEINGQPVSDGTVTATLALAQDVGEDWHWNYSGGGFAIFPAPVNGGVRVGNTNATFAARFRVNARGNDNDNYILTSGTGGLGGSNGLKISNNGTATGDLRVEWRYGTGTLVGAVTVPYVTGDIITIVSRGDAFEVGNGGTHEVWVDGQAGDNPDYFASFASWANYSNTEGHFIVYGEGVDVFDLAFWNERKTQAECRALATDLRAELVAALGSANLPPTQTAPIGTISATVGVPLAFDLLAHFADDNDALTFSVNAGGTALPPWATIVDTAIVGTPGPGDLVTTTGHVLDYSDGFNPVAQSTAFSIAVSDLPTLVLSDIVTGANVLFGPGDTFTIDVLNNATGAAALRVTGQEPNAGGDLELKNAALTVGVLYKAVFENETTGHCGVVKVTAT